MLSLYAIETPKFTFKTIGFQTSLSPYSTWFTRWLKHGTIYLQDSCTFVQTLVLVRICFLVRLFEYVVCLLISKMQLVLIVSCSVFSFIAEIRSLRRMRPHRLYVGLLIHRLLLSFDWTFHW